VTDRTNSDRRSSSVAAIINPISGAGADPDVARGRIAMIQGAAAQRGLTIDVQLTERAGHATSLAEAALARGCTSVIVWGGDGTLNEVGRALIGSSVALGLVPAGSGNGLAAALEVPRQPERAVADAFDAPIRPIDAGVIAGRPFFNVAGIGFDAHVAALFNQRAKGARGGWPYISIGIREGFRYQARAYRIILDGVEQRTNALLIAFANGPEFGLRTRIAPGARVDDGVLDAVVVSDPGFVLARFWHARHLATGNPQRASILSRTAVTHAIIDIEGDVAFHVDGEPAVTSGPVEVSILPAALRVRSRHR
jgi:diacylglycerol kinase (ATP)